MIKSVIIEDEQKTLESLKYLLSKYCPDVEVSATADNFQQAYTLILKEQPQLIFMDIQLNSEDGTGIDLISTLNLSECAVVFISGYKDYAIEAFRLQAVDYLLKPLRISHLIEAVDKAKKYIDLKRSHQKDSSGTHRQDSFHVPTQQGFIIIRHSDIIRCEADGAYTHFYVKGKKERITSSINIGQVERKLGPEFFRIHKSHIVNKDSVQSYSKSEGLILKMADGSEVPVAKAHKDSFFKWLN